MIHSGDPVADRRGRKLFVAAYDEEHKLERDGDHKATLIVGKDEWPLPIPLVREHAHWRFDTKAGADEILNRRIGRNELNVIEVCRAYVEAQREYAAKKLGPGGTAEYAQHFMSKIGQRDGLYGRSKPVKKKARWDRSSPAPSGRLSARNSASEATTLLWLLFPHSHPARAECTRRGEGLCRRRPYDRRLCADRLSGHLWRFGYYDIHRQSGWHCLSKEF